MWYCINLFLYYHAKLSEVWSSKNLHPSIKKSQIKRNRQILLLYVIVAYLLLYWSFRMVNCSTNLRELNALQKRCYDVCSEMLWFFKKNCEMIFHFEWILLPTTNQFFSSVFYFILFFRIECEVSYVPKIKVTRALKKATPTG